MRLGGGAVEVDDPPAYTGVRACGWAAARWRWTAGEGVESWHRAERVRPWSRIRANVGRRSAEGRGPIGVGGREV
jgi:hypothetical protein